MDELHGEWFERGEALADEEVTEEAPRPNLLARFAIALAGAAALVAALVAIVVT
jgi:hypothetical protein